MRKPVSKNNNKNQSCDSPETPSHFGHPTGGLLRVKGKEVMPSLLSEGGNRGGQRLTRWLEGLRPGEGWVSARPRKRIGRL